MPAQLSSLQTKPAADDLRSILAWNVRRYRVRQKMSQEQLAFASDLDRTYVSALERRVWNASLSSIEKIAAALQVSPWKLLYIETTDDSH
jgi:transcriptional regulator with XRE-family HTH domain